MLVAPLNVSAGCAGPALDQIVEAAGRALLDVHSDRDHNRSVVTVVGEEAPRAVAQAAVTLIDLSRHTGAHPRFGAIDVVPFVPTPSSTLADAVLARDRFLRWAADELDLPGFAYGEGAPSLPEIRRSAFVTRRPDVGPDRPHPTAGAVAVGARGSLVAYNVWLAVPDLAVARQVAAAVRSPAIRTLGLLVGTRVQVSMNLVDPFRVGPAAAYDAVAALAPVAGAELVGLLPDAVLAAVPADRWPELDLTPDRTVEARLAQRQR